ncbi:hypothetical protein I7I51_06567, partial [Histoplasma capsulatum]
MFPRTEGDRPAVIPPETMNLAFIGQYVEIPDDTVFSMECSVRSAQMAVYGLMDIAKEAKKERLLNSQRSYKGYFTRIPLSQGHDLFVRCCVYFAFFGPQPSLRQGADKPPSSVPMSPLFVSENSPIDGPSEARGHEYIIQHPQDDGRNGIPPGPGSQGSAVAMDTDEREAMWTDIATEWTAEERASEAHMAETARLQPIAEDMDRRARVAEEKAASHAAELARVQKEADERAARAAEQVRAQRDAEQAVQQVHRQEETESMARRAREAEDRVAAQAAELERLRKGATERAVQGAEQTLSQVDHDGSATVLAQLQNETLEGLAEPAPENIPLPLDDDTTMAEPSRPVTQLDVSSLMARWCERGDQPDDDGIPLPRNTHKRTPVERRRAKAAGIRKSRMKGRPTRRAADRVANRAAVINDQLQRNTERRGSASRLRIEESSGADVSAPLSDPHGAQSETTQAQSKDTPATD